MDDGSDSDSVVTEEYASKFEEISQPLCGKSDHVDDRRNAICQDESLLTTSIWTEGDRMKSVCSVSIDSLSNRQVRRERTPTGEICIEAGKVIKNETMNYQNGLKDWPPTSTTLLTANENRSHFSLGADRMITLCEGSRPRKESIAVSSPHSSRLNRSTRNIMPALDPPNSTPLRRRIQRAPSLETTVGSRVHASSPWLATRSQKQYNRERGESRVTNPVIPLCSNNRPSGKTHQATMSNSEVEAIINERDELYEILRINEEEESARYATEKTLVTVKQEAFKEQQRLHQRINALEEELEMSLCQLNQLNSERGQWTREMDSHTARQEGLQHELNATCQRHEKEIKELDIHFNERLRVRLQEQADHFADEKKRLETEICEKTQNWESKQCDLEGSMAKLHHQLEEVKRMHTEKQEEHNEALIQEREERRKLVQDYDKLFEDRLMEKTQELIDIKDEHAERINTMLEELKQEKEATISDLKSCYIQRIEELQESISRFSRENDTMKETIQQLQSRISQMQSEQTSESFMRKMCSTVLNEFSEKEREKTVYWEAKMRDLRSETDNVNETLRNELEAERESLYRSKLETNDLLKRFEEYQTKAEDRIRKYQKDFEQLEAKHELDLTKKEVNNQEMLAMVEAENALETRKNFEEKLRQFRMVCDDQVLREREELRTELHATLDRTLSQMANWADALVQMLENSVKKIADQFPNVGETLIKRSEEKSQHIYMTNCVNSARASSLADNWRVLISEFSAQTNNRLHELHDAVYRSSTNYQTLFQELSLSVESQVRETQKRIQKRFENDMMNYRESMETEFQNKIEKLQNISPDRKVADELKQNEREFNALRSQMEVWKEDTRRKLMVELREEINVEYEAKLHQQIKAYKSQYKSPQQNPEVQQVSAQGTRVIGELKNRIERLREENLSLRRLLLRRPLTVNKLGKSLIEIRPSLMSKPAATVDQRSNDHQQD